MIFFFSLWFSLPGWRLSWCSGWPCAWAQHGPWTGATSRPVTRVLSASKCKRRSLAMRLYVCFPRRSASFLIWCLHQASAGPQTRRLPLSSPAGDHGADKHQTHPAAHQRQQQGRFTSKSVTFSSFYSSVKEKLGHISVRFSKIHP